MKVAVVYNRDTKGVVNVLGMQSREWYPEETISKVVNALTKAGHQVEAIAFNRYLLSRLNKFLPKLSRRQAPGIVFNMALGAQGKSRYSQLPALLELAGIAYTGSSPTGHLLSLDKVVAKQIFMASGIPTPNYQVFTRPDQSAEHLKYPLIVKPRGEAASLGLEIVHDDQALKEAVRVVLDDFKQPALVEEFIEGREINVSIIGNEDPRPLPVLELVLPDSQNAILSYDDKFHHSNRKIAKVCPAGLPPETGAYIQKVAVQAFLALNLFDYGRVDIRLDHYHQPHVLEMNSMASLNPASSFVLAARKAGMSYNQLVNKILQVAIERYALEEPEIFGFQNRHLHNQAKA